MNDSVEAQGGSVGRLLAVGGALLLLVALFFGSRLARNWGDGLPLNPNDPMSMWRDASDAQKRATAEEIVRGFQDRQLLGPVARAMLRTSGNAPLVDALVAGLDAAANPNVKEYVSPGTAMIDVAESLAIELGWDK